jgi:ABC-type branched-subunit amino acid transport system ATPase component
MAETLLSLQNVHAGYGDALVLHDVSLDVAANGSLAVLGRNGVGKSTLLLTIMGYTHLRSGTLYWRGRDIAPVTASAGSPRSAKSSPRYLSRKTSRPQPGPAHGA